MCDSIYTIILNTGDDRDMSLYQIKVNNIIIYYHHTNCYKFPHHHYNYTALLHSKYPAGLDSEPELADLDHE